MKATVTQLVGKEYVDKACSFTVNKEVHPDLYKLYKSEHSPIRCSIFWIELTDIPTFVSIHFSRHKIGVEHFIKSNREDRPGFTGDLGRLQPVNHAMLINAQALLNMARKRLCHKTHADTRALMEMIKAEMLPVDKALSWLMIPECKYRSECPEFKPCGEM